MHAYLHVLIRMSDVFLRRWIKSRDGQTKGVSKGGTMGAASGGRVAVVKWISLRRVGFASNALGLCCAGKTGCRECFGKYWHMSVKERGEGVKGKKRVGLGLQLLSNNRRLLSSKTLTKSRLSRVSISRERTLLLLLLRPIYGLVLANRF